MNRRMRLEQFKTQLYGLSDESVEFRSTWRGRFGLAVWLALSIFSLLVMTISSGVNAPLDFGVILVMSFLKYIPLLMVVYSLARVNDGPLFG